MKRSIYFLIALLTMFSQAYAQNQMTSGEMIKLIENKLSINVPMTHSKDIIVNNFDIDEINEDAIKELLVHALRAPLSVYLAKDSYKQDKSLWKIKDKQIFFINTTVNDFGLLRPFMDVDDSMSFLPNHQIVVYVGDKENFEQIKTFSENFVASKN